MVKRRSRGVGQDKSASQGKQDTQFAEKLHKFGEVSEGNDTGTVVPS